MSLKKSSVDFMAGLRSLEKEATQRRPRLRHTTAESPPGSEGEKRLASAGTRQNSRRGKVAMTLWVDPAVRKQLGQIHLDHDKTQAALVAEALNLLFEKYGKSSIATA